MGETKHPQNTYHQTSSMASRLDRKGVVAVRYRCLLLQHMLILLASAQGRSILAKIIILASEKIYLSRSSSYDNERFSAIILALRRRSSSMWQFRSSNRAVSLRALLSKNKALLQHRALAVSRQGLSQLRIIVAVFWYLA
ncbi:hypothetical protein LI328DRAFT_161840 [Trichoderma asperelloides]|nr:hypothetical protein LI328DRAFT_161840 [Trichoderma asperelloides]